MVPWVVGSNPTFHPERKRFARASFFVFIYSFVENDYFCSKFDNTMNKSYRINLRREPEGGYTVFVPSLPGCITYGETVDEAIDMAREAIELFIEELEDRGEPIPDDSNMLEYSLNLAMA